MAAFTVQQGKRYRATISLGVLKRLASNASLADRLEAAGFTEVSVTSSGRTRIAGVEVLRGAPLEVESRYAAVGSPGRIALLTTNVFQKSRDADALLKIIGEANPDLVLAVETDEWWCTQLSEGLRARYPHSLIYPLSNGYGLAAFSRLELTDPAIRFLVDDAITPRSRPALGFAQAR